MSRKVRVLIAFIVIEAMLGGLWFYLTALRVDQGANGGDSAATADAVQTIGSTMGMVMGGLAGLFLVMFVIAAKNDRQA